MEFYNIYQVDWQLLGITPNPTLWHIFACCTVWVKKNPPYGFLKFFPKRLGIFNQFLHTYYVIVSTLDYKLLFNYLQLWQSYAILSATT